MRSPEAFMTVTPAIRALLRAICPCALIAVILGACHDADGDPTAVLVAEESRSALMLRTELPALPDLVGRARAEDRAHEAVETWIGSWEAVSIEEGRRLRKGAYRQVAGPLAEELGVEGARGAARTLGEALNAVLTVADEDFPPDVLIRLDEARGLHERTTAALEAGRVADAFAFTLEGADALREVGPEGVARTLIMRAEGALADARKAETLDAEELERSDRLVRGARLALDDDDWSRALRRAYYACQILGVSPH